MHRWWLFGFLSICMASLFAASSAEYYRSFWQPTYLGKRLAYCDKQACGLPVAKAYCQRMGYKTANKMIRAHNVGMSTFLSSGMRCRGWGCDGFETIRCIGYLTHNPPKPYHYRLRHFVYPRYAGYRVDWCYDGTHHCGHRAANSFCRRMGYSKTRRYAIAHHVGATKALENEKLCFGKSCQGFTYIDCFR